ncbi:M56 family metallopeptidase [Granulicella tundricola]|uniref:Peptidase M56 BlaR1 n=1 Tax=Granulicella tundricola (strain ATCC BAA-1859 / DSM 23138 / MP5ACTX9) TaxID=1198114 RepID=E8X2S1_GRATM|nr:M56 family metallopeptidase [Granulicella tundricola]ADW70368.1 peptidase M56 BlaR1 [Granulicella tundricola MP5ACTX9]
MMMSVARHLLESTLFASFMLLLVVLLRRQAASLRHMLLLAAVLKFAVPLEGLQMFGTLLRRRLPQRIEPFQIQLPILDIQRRHSLAQPLQDSTLLHVALAFWVVGTVVLLAIWIMALNKVGKTSLNTAPDHIQALRQASRRLRVTRTVEIRTSTEARDPYLMGLFRPVLVIPESLPETLSAAEYEAILLHELAHAKRWDNLTRSSVHVLVCVFWFYPLLRWLERRIEGEAELACDELVLNAGVTATDYLQGICKVCQQFLLRPLAGRSHVNSFNLRNRMELIMSFSSPKRGVPFSSAFAVLPFSSLRLPQLQPALHLHPMTLRRPVLLQLRIAA